MRFVPTLLFLLAVAGCTASPPVGDDASRQRVFTAPAAEVEAPDPAYTQYGAPAVGIGDVNGDGYDDVVFTTLEGAGPAARHPTIWLAFGSPDGLHPENTAQNPVQIASQELAGFGSALAAVGDLNGDGWPDFIVGSPHELREGREVGAVHVFLTETYLPPGPDSDAKFREAPQFRQLVIDSPIFAEDGQRFGASLADVGGFMGDAGNQAAFAVGAPGLATPRVFVFRPSPTFSSDDEFLLVTTLLPHDTNSDDGFGEVVAGLGDISGDGLTDIAVGVPGSDQVAIYCGSIGPLPTHPTRRFIGSQPGSRFGASVAMGPLNKLMSPNARSEIAIGSPNFSQDGLAGRGRVSIFVTGGIGHSAFCGPNQPGDPVPETAIHLLGLSQDEHLGHSLAIVPDINGDGFADLVAGYPGVTSSGIRVFYGSTSPVSTSAAGSQVSDGTEAQGSWVSPAGDVNGDGLADVLFGNQNQERGYFSVLLGERDFDRDHYSPDCGAACADCDDNNSAVNPSAVEVCDGIDNDCDGLVDDEDPNLDQASGSVFFLDADGDGFGDPASQVVACVAPPQYVSNGDDCNDANALVYPAAPQRCEGVDNNCNGLVGDEDPLVDIQFQSTYFLDADGDGFGDPNEQVVACLAPPQHVSNSDDCDDANALVYPFAAEVCDGVDNNCSGLIDDDDPSVDQASQTVYFLDGDGDGFGDPNAQVYACEMPAQHATIAGDCDDTDELVYPFAVELCDGIDNDCDGIVPADEVDLDGDTYLACEDCDDAEPRAWLSCDDCRDDDGDGAYVGCDDLLGDPPDCDDGDATRFVGNPEVCGSGTDENCNGLVDWDDPDCDLADALPARCGCAATTPASGRLAQGLGAFAGLLLLARRRRTSTVETGMLRRRLRRARSDR